MHVCMCTLCIQGLEEGVGSPNTGITASFEPPDVMLATELWFSTKVASKCLNHFNH